MSAQWVYIVVEPGTGEVWVFAAERDAQWKHELLRREGRTTLVKDRVVGR